MNRANFRLPYRIWKKRRLMPLLITNVVRLLMNADREKEEANGRIIFFFWLLKLIVDKFQLSDINIFSGYYDILQLEGNMSRWQAGLRNFECKFYGN